MEERRAVSRLAMGIAEPGLIVVSAWHGPSSYNIYMSSGTRIAMFNYRYGTWDLVTVSSKIGVTRWHKTRSASTNEVIVRLLAIMEDPLV
jgi:hypothetical protein